MTDIQPFPATDEIVAYIEQNLFETISRQVALELLARIRADAERIRVAEAEVSRLRQVYENFTDAIRLAVYSGWGHGRTHQQYVADVSRLREHAEAAEARCAWLEKALKLYQYSDGHFWHCIAHDFPGEPCEEFCRNAQAALSAPDAQAETSEESHLSPEEVCRNTAQIWMQTEGRFMYGEFTELDVTSLMSVLLRERRAAFARARDIAFDVGGGLGEEIARLIKIEMKK